MSNSSQRNSLLELYRFFLSLIILAYHGFTIVYFQTFTNGNFAVDFFFMITGLYFVKTIQKYDSYSISRGGYLIVWDRLKKLGYPLLVSYLFVVLNNLLDEEHKVAIHYLWFIHIMMICYLLFFLIYRFVKGDLKKFFTITGVFFGICYILRFSQLFFDGPLSNASSFDEVRCILCIPIGMYIANSPKLDLSKPVNSQKRLKIIVCILGLIIFGVFKISSLSDGAKIGAEILSDFILFPGIIYITLHIQCENKIFDALGGLSIPIYLYQSISRFLGIESFNILSNKWYGFTAVLIATTLTLLWRYVNKRHQQDEQSISSS